MNFSDEAQWRTEWKRDKYAFYPSRTIPMARCFHSKYFLPLLQTRIHLRNDWGILEFSPRINDRVPLFVSFFFFFIVSQLLSRRKNVCLLGKRNLIASRWLWIYAVDLCSVSKYTVSPVIRGPIFHISFFSPGLQTFDIDSPRSFIQVCFRWTTRFYQIFDKVE